MNYVLKFSFTTAKAGRGGCIRGRGGNGECDIVTDIPLDELKEQIDDLKSIAYNSLILNEKVNKMGYIQSIDILDVLNSNNQ